MRHYFRDPNAKLFFRTLDQVVLFEMEIMGQLSDGAWENTRPDDHWQFWSDAKVDVAAYPEQVGRNFFVAKDDYGLTRKDLLEVVGDRMIVYVKLSRAFGREATAEIDHLIDYTSGKVRGYIANDPKYTHTLEKFWSLGIPLDKIKAVVDANTYTMEDLKKDLREIKKAMRRWSQAQPVPVPISTIPEPRPVGFSDLYAALRGDKLDDLVEASLTPEQDQDRDWYDWSLW